MQQNTEHDQRPEPRSRQGPDPPADRSTDERTPQTPIVLFDGMCGLCNAWVDLVMNHDRKARYRFATLQSDAGRRILEQSNLSANDTESVVLRDHQGVWTKSSAALRIFKGLGLPFCLAYGLKLIPRPIRDRAYDVIAKHRYRWFGRRTVCRVPSADERSRFIGREEGEGSGVRKPRTRQ